MAKDIDFDEIDRAVNGAMSKEPVRVAVSDRDTQQIKVATRTPEPQKVLPKALPTIPIYVPASTVNRPNSGKFMDMAQQPNAAAIKRPVVSQPRPNISEAPVSPRPITPQPRIEVGSSSIKVNNRSQIPAATAVMTNPVPISQNALDEPIKSVVNQTVVDNEYDDIDRISNDITETLSGSKKSAPLSPFLTNAKVEKRPLGAFSDGKPRTQKEIDDSAEQLGLSTMPSQNVRYSDKPVTSFSGSDNQPVSEEHLNAKFETPLPAELQGELLSIESDSSIIEDQPQAEAAPQVTSAQVNGPKFADKPVAAPIPASQPAPTLAANDDCSIKTQYKEKPNTLSQEPSAIYDTKNYHKPMNKNSRPKSSHAWVIWLFLIIILGAGLGAAVYFLVFAN